MNETDPIKVISYRSNNGTRTGLIVKEGRAYIHILLLDNPLRITKVPLAEWRYINELPGYPLKKAKRIFRRCARLWSNDLSRSVKNALKD